MPAPGRGRLPSGPVLLALRIGVLLAALLLWHVLTAAGILDPFFFSRPIEVVQRVWHELAGGGMVLVPFGWGFGMTVMAGAGYAIRDPYDGGGDRHGAIALATLALGYRPYDHFDPYGHGISVYASGRAAFAGWDAWQITAGVEVDLEFVFWSPFAFAATALSGSDPHEED